MLRPSCLLPAARLAPPHGLLTPRSGTEVSLQYLGPAIRRSDAYRHGTLTRWTCAACSSSSYPLRVQSCLCFVTHHPAIVEAGFWAATGLAWRGPTCQPDPYVFDELALLHEARGDAAAAARYRALRSPSAPR